MGDMQIFSSFRSLLEKVEAIDVRNNEYFAYTSEGRRILLRAASDYAAVEGEIEANPNHIDDVRQLLF